MIYRPAETALAARGQKRGLPDRQRPGHVALPGRGRAGIVVGPAGARGHHARGFAEKHLWLTPLSDMAGVAVSFLDGDGVCLWLHRGEFSQCLHPPDAAGAKHRPSALSLSALRLFHSVVFEHSRWSPGFGWAADAPIARRPFLRAICWSNCSPRRSSRPAGSNSARISPLLPVAYAHSHRRLDRRLFH